MKIRKNHWTPQQFEIPRGTCLFCGENLEARGGRTKEHVIPQWLLRHYDIKRTELKGTWYSATNDFKAKDIRPQVFGSLVNGKVCAEC